MSPADAITGQGASPYVCAWIAAAATPGHRGLDGRRLERDARAAGRSLTARRRLALACRSRASLRPPLPASARRGPRAAAPRSRASRARRPRQRARLASGAA